MYTANMNIHNEILKKWDKDTEKSVKNPRRFPAWAYSSAG